jgi:hypothetical protein
LAKQSVIVLDNPPLEDDAWAEEVFALSRHPKVKNEAVAQEMSKDEEARPALLKYAGNPVMHAEQLAPHYKRALDKLHGGEPRVGLYGTAWVVYTQPVDAVVVDWSEVEKRANDPKAANGPGEMFRQQSHAFIRERLRKHVAPEKVLELPNGLSQKEKVAQTMAFLKKLGLAN